MLRYEIERTRSEEVHPCRIHDWTQSLVEDPRNKSYESSYIAAI